MESVPMYSYRLLNRQPWQPEHYVAPTPCVGELEGEIGRHLRRHLQVVKFKGGLLPSSINLKHVDSVLDVGCGFGMWTQAMAVQYPSIVYVGIDRNPMAIAIAEQILPKGTKNAHYLVQDVQTPGKAPFGYGRFDLVHLRWLAGEVPCEQFGMLLRLLAQQCRTGGAIVWTEAELPLTSSYACDFISSILLTALENMGRMFLPTVSLSLGLPARMACWLRDTGCVLKQDEDDMIPIDTGTEAHPVFVEEMERMARRIQPFVLQAGVTTEDVYSDLLVRLGHEIRERDFQGVFRLRTLVASKR